MGAGASFLEGQTYATNVMGAVHVLDALRAVQGIKVAVMVTTDKVYSNREWPWPYRESDRLGGHDPYSASKAACELAIASYRDSFLRMQGVAIASARAGNVVGGGDWSEDRLIPDAIRAWQAGRVLEVRRPQAIRPWQHVLEPLCGYLNLAQTLWNRPELAGSYNFGPEAQGAVTVRHLLQLANTCYGQGDVHYAVEEAGVHEARQLSLDISQARGVLRFAPKWPLARTIAQTMAWYVAQQAGGDARSLCDADICAYMEPP